MKAGTMNSRVTIRRPATTQDSLGQPAAAWVDVATLWADVLHTSGVEQIKADTILSVVRVSVRIRYRTDITSGMRVYYGTNVYDIKAVLPETRAHDHTDLACELVT